MKVGVGPGGVTITLDASQAGTATISGSGLKTTTNNLAAGTSRIMVAFSKGGKRDRKHHEKIKLTVQLKAADRTVLGARTVRL